MMFLTCKKLTKDSNYDPGNDEEFNESENINFEDNAGHQTPSKIRK